MPLPNADDLLGKPSADELLGPEAPAEPQAQALTNSPAQVSGWQRYPALAGSALAHGLAVGLGLPGDLESLGVKYGVNPLQRLLGQQEDDPTKTIFPTSETLVNAASQAGMTNRADLTPGWGPYGEAERLGSAAISGIGSAIPQALMGGRPLATLAAGAAGGGAGEATGQLFPGSSLAPVVAGGLAGLGTQGLAGMLPNDAIKREAQALGSSDTLQKAGASLQPAAKRWLDQVLPAKEDAVWSPVDQALKTNLAPQGPAVPLTNYQGVLDSITGRGGSLAASSKLLRPQLPDKMKDALDSLSISGTVPNWDEVRQLRSDIGSALSNPKIAQDIGPKNLDKMYAAITQDLSGAASAAGAGDLFSRANATSSQLRTLADQHIRPLVDDGIAPEKAAKQALASASAGGTKLSALRAAIPDAVDELASAHLLQSPQGWAKLAPEAKAALVPDAGQRMRVEQAVQAKLSSGPPPLAQAVHGLAGGSIGEMAGVLAQHFLPNLDQLTAGAAGGLLGILGPNILRGAAGVVKNPRSVGLPVAGALGGTNALFPNGQQ